jgi:two-component system cell cycle response regulator
MTARVLVVDDIPANVKLLEARLSAEYFDVTTALSGQEALRICERAQCDVVLLDAMMPGLDGFEVCRRLKSGPTTHHIPVVMVTALDQPSDRIKGLEAGADDFLTKPVSDVALIARVRSLSRLKMMTDELRMRAVTSREIGIESPEREALAGAGRGGRILMVDDHRTLAERVLSSLADEHTAELETNPTESLFHAVEGNYDLLIVSLDLDNFDSLRLCSQLRSLERTRNVPILAIAAADNDTRLVRALEIGVNDYLVRPIDKNEILARARTQIRKKRYTEWLRDNAQLSIEMAITDALTGLYNRRYMESHVGTLVEQAVARDKPLAVLLLDIDYFKSINDGHGHDAGDDVLREFALRIRKSIRGLDLACRYGGEEFVVVMPETDMAVATMVAERLRRRIASEPFAIQKGARSASRRSGPTTIPPPSSSAPIRRSTAPSATAATGWCRTRHNRPGKPGPSGGAGPGTPLRRNCDGQP